MPRNRENWRIFEPIFEPQFDGFCVKIIYKITTFWVAGQQFIGHPAHPSIGGFLVVELQPFSLRKDTKNRPISHPGLLQSLLSIPRSVQQTGFNSLKTVTDRQRDPQESFHIFPAGRDKLGGDLRFRAECPETGKSSGFLSQFSNPNLTDFVSKLYTK